MTYRNIDPTAGGFGSDWGMYGGAGSNYSGGGDEIWNDLCNFGGSTASRAAAAVAQQEKINSFNATLEGTGLQIGDDESWQDSRPKKKDGTTDGGKAQNNSFGVFFDGMDLYYAGFNPVLDKIAKGSGLRNYSIHKSDHVMSADDATDGAFNQIVNFNNANPDAPIFLYGYSYGGVLANHLAKRLDAVGVKIAYMATVDAANGWWSASVDRSIPNNVEWNDNFYQTTESYIGSRGYPNTGVNVHNYQMRNADHHSIDEATSTMITRMMQVFLNSQYQTSKP